jgi:hypothetical protein
MLFPPQMAQLLAHSAASRRQAPAAAPRPRRALLGGPRFPRRSRRVVAAGRLLVRVQSPQSPQSPQSR